jgi:hypothetical protein
MYAFETHFWPVLGDEASGSGVAGPGRSTEKSKGQNEAASGRNSVSGRSGSGRVSPPTAGRFSPQGSMGSNLFGGEGGGSPSGGSLGATLLARMNSTGSGGGSSPKTNHGRTLMASTSNVGKEKGESGNGGNNNNNSNSAVKTTGNQTTTTEAEKVSLLKRHHSKLFKIFNHFSAEHRAGGGQHTACVNTNNNNNNNNNKLMSIPEFMYMCTSLKISDNPTKKLCEEEIASIVVSSFMYCGSRSTDLMGFPDFWEAIFNIAEYVTYDGICEGGRRIDNFLVNEVYGNVGKYTMLDTKLW